MNYLHHANKHISSSHNLHGPRKKIGIGRIVLMLIIALVVFLTLKTPLSNILFALRQLVTPDLPGEITLERGALDAQLKALEVENTELKQLLNRAGVRLPKIDPYIDPVEEVVQTGAELDVLDINTIATSTASSIELTSTSSQKIEIHLGDVLTTVLMRPPQSPFDLIVLGAGANQGVEVGDVVYAFNGFPIGTIVSVEPKRSTAELFSAPGKKTEVFIGTSTTSVIAEGKGGGNFALKLPKVSEIRVGDMVARRLLDIEVFGTINSVDADEGEAFIYAYFKLPINLNSLTYVLVKKDLYR